MASALAEAGADSWLVARGDMGALQKSSPPRRSSVVVARSRTPGRAGEDRGGAYEAFGRADILVNNAGIMPRRCWSFPADLISAGAHVAARDEHEVRAGLGEAEAMAAPSPREARDDATFRRGESCRGSRPWGHQRSCATGADPCRQTPGSRRPCPRRRHRPRPTPLWMDHGGERAISRSRTTRWRVADGSPRNETRPRWAAR